MNDIVVDDLGAADEHDLAAGGSVDSLGVSADLSILITEGVKLEQSSLLVSDLNNTPLFTGGDADDFLAVSLPPEILVGSRSLFGAFCGHLPERLAAALVRDLVITPFPHVAILIEAVGNHAFRPDFGHVGTRREDGVTPVRSS